MSNDINTDDVLALMGLKPPRASARHLSTPSLDVAPSSGGNTLDLVSASATEPLPPSVLSQALQNLAIESGTQAVTSSLPNGTESAGHFSQGDNLEPSLFPIQASGPSLEGVPIFQQPTIQTSPPPGTTGYVAPPPLPSPPLSGQTVIPPAAVDVMPNVPLGSVSPSAAITPYSPAHSECTAISTNT